MLVFCNSQISINAIVVVSAHFQVTSRKNVVFAGLVLRFQLVGAIPFYEN